MLSTRLFRLIHDKRLSVPVLRYFHDEFTKPEIKPATVKKQDNEVVQEESEPSILSGAMRHKFKEFKEEESPEILDVVEERERYQTQDEPDDMYNDAYHGLNLKRGVNGVFDVEDLVDVLRKESAEDIFVCSVPKELKYVDHMVICSGRSYRHMLATAEFVRRVYKMKRQKGDILPKIEGEKSRDWMAMDLGNIALHIFSPKTRETYDLESLWAIGVEFDKEYNKPQDPLVELFERHSTLLADIKPLNQS
ncbi:ribosomal silencing factor RsfS-like protein, 312 [Musca autumnalis]|uniref:ribosomal silencing factor RsfS-like protein, 312 n=1 Tax=Musca autumnalis TaxID=221902 RepID=UPI003CF56DF0